MNAPRSVLVVGATSRIAEHCARLWLAAGTGRLLLVGRDADRTRQLADDLRVRAPQATIEVATADFTDPADIARCVAAACTPEPPEAALVAHGSLPDQAACQADLVLAHEALRINGASPALFAEAIAGRMAARGSGTLAVIGSVAGDRGRKSNYVYGAAKGLVDRWLQGLQHRLAGSGVRVVIVKPGPTDTPMTAHLKARGARLAAPEDVAAAIVRGMAAGRPVVYAPARWALVMLVIRHLPRFVFHRLDL